MSEGIAEPNPILYKDSERREQHQAKSRLLSTSIAEPPPILYKDSEYNLILSDLRLPDHDGLFLLEWTKKHKTGLPFIDMTNYAEVQLAMLLPKNISDIKNDEIKINCNKVINGLLAFIREIESEIS